MIVSSLYSSGFHWKPKSSILVKQRISMELARNGLYRLWREVTNRIRCFSSALSVPARSRMGIADLELANSSLSEGSASDKSDQAGLGWGKLGFKTSPHTLAFR